MSVEFLLGPAGSGKTYRCLEQVRDALVLAPEGAPLIFLAPKQATYQIERRLLIELGVPGFNRLQIVSFERLALFLLDHFGLPSPEVLSEEGRAMVIRSLLLRHGGTLGSFGVSSRGAGFARALSGWLRELQQHHGNPQRLRGAAVHPETPHSLRGKLSDAATVLEHYLGWLKERGLNDPDLALPLATEELRDRLRKSKTPPLGWVWLDGFAELTPAELDLLDVAVRASAGASLAFCLPANEVESVSGFDLWSNIRETFRACHARLTVNAGESITLTSLPANNTCTRFAASPILAHTGLQLTRLVPQASPAPDELLSPHLQLWHCPHPEAEAELAARVVLEHVQNGGRFREVGIVPRTLQGYATSFARVFRRHGIPLFIDQRASIGHHPAIELIRGAFRVASRNWTPADVFAVLKTGLAIRDPSTADRLENAALASGWAKDRWIAETDPELTTEIESARIRLGIPLQEFERMVGPEPSGLTISTAISQLLVTWDVEKQLDDWHLASPDAPHNTVWKALQTWQQNVRLAFANDALPLDSWAEIFESGLSGLSVGVLPPALDQVLLGTVDRSRNPELKVAIVPGLNDGVFPARPPAPQILGQHETLWLEAAGLGRSGASLRRMAHERFFAYIALTRASQRVIATWSAANSQGETMEPSPIARQLRQAFPNLHVREFAEPEVADLRHPAQWLFSRFAFPTSTPFEPAAIADVPLLPRALESGWKSPSPDDRLRPELATALFGPRFRFSPSQLEAFAECPFQHFTLHGLTCVERPTFETDARDRGSFEHAVLATFHRHLVRDEKRWRELPVREIDQRIGEAVEFEMRNEGREAFASTASALYRTRAIRSRLGNLVQRIVGAMQSHAFDPVDVEVRIKLPSADIDMPDESCIEVEGRLDRVDIARDPSTGAEFTLIADYKSRSRSFDGEKLYLGTEIQAPLYAAAAGKALRSGAARQPAGWVWIPIRQKVERSVSREADEPDKPKAWMRGRLSLDALPLLSYGPADTSPFAIQLKRDGQPFATSDLRSADELRRLLQDALNIAHGLGRLIVGGTADPAPLLHKGQLACEYCRVKEICRFDPQQTAPRTTPLFPLHPDQST